jgi:hypothetical protein
MPETGSAEQTDPQSGAGLSIAGRISRGLTNYRASGCSARLTDSKPRACFRAEVFDEGLARVRT